MQKDKNNDTIYKKGQIMKTFLIAMLTLTFMTGCVSTPYAQIGASKSVNIGGIDVGVGIGNIINLAR
jgi:hypothetical protein